MAEAKINETCIIGLPTCGYAFSSSRMAFIAAPSDDEFRLELDIVQDLLAGKDYEAYIAVQRDDPAKLAFCTKICSKIIQSQFCVVLRMLLDTTTIQTCSSPTQTFILNMG